MYRLLYN